MGKSGILIIYWRSKTQTTAPIDASPSAADYAVMAPAALKLTPAEVAARIRPYVANMTMPAFPDITFSVSEEGIRLSRGYWRVPIHPSRDPKSVYGNSVFALTGP